MIELPPFFSKVADLKWIITRQFSYRQQAEQLIDILFKKAYPNAKIYCEEFDPKYKFVFRIVIEFENEADEVEFIMRESS